jgi:hypothetical protein
MNEKQIAELVIKKIGPVGCCRTHKGKERYRYGKVWRWFLMRDGVWNETQKYVLRGMIMRALPSRVQIVKNVGMVLTHIKLTCYSEKFETMGWVADN